MHSKSFHRAVRRAARLTGLGIVLSAGVACANVMLITPTGTSAISGAVPYSELAGGASLLVNNVLFSNFSAFSNTGIGVVADPTQVTVAGVDAQSANAGLLFTGNNQFGVNTETNGTSNATLNVSFSYSVSAAPGVINQFNNNLLTYAVSTDRITADVAVADGSGAALGNANTFADNELSGTTTQLTQAVLAISPAVATITVHDNLQSYQTYDSGIGYIGTFSQGVQTIPEPASVVLAIPLTLALVMRRRRGSLAGR